jgi:hypothetical protein
LLSGKKDFDQQLFMLTSTVRTVKEEEKKNLNDCWTTLSYLYHYMCVCFSFSFFGLLKEKKKKIPASVC